MGMRNFIGMTKMFSNYCDDGYTTQYIYQRSLDCALKMGEHDI